MVTAELNTTSPMLATLELRKRPGKSEVDNASWDCFRGRKQKAVNSLSLYIYMER